MLENLSFDSGKPLDELYRIADKCKYNDTKIKEQVNPEEEKIEVEKEISYEDNEDYEDYEEEDELDVVEEEVV